MLSPLLEAKGAVDANDNLTVRRKVLLDNCLGGVNPCSPADDHQHVGARPHQPVMKRLVFQVHLHQRTCCLSQHPMQSQQRAACLEMYFYRVPCLKHGRIAPAITLSMSIIGYEGGRVQVRNNAESPPLAVCASVSLQQIHAAFGAQTAPHAHAARR